MNDQNIRPNIEDDGWMLVSAELRQSSHPDTFQIPPRSEREALAPGDGAQLLFDIETRDSGQIVDRGVDRMWVIVKSRNDEGYVGVLDSDPGTAENLHLHEGDTIVFRPEHVVEMSKPPHDYVIEKYGKSFFDQ